MSQRRLASRGGPAPVCTGSGPGPSACPTSSCPSFARGIARVTLGLLFGLERGQSGGFFFLFAGEKGGGFGRGCGLAHLLFGLGGLAGLLRLGARCGLRLRSACRRFTSGSSGPGWARNLFRCSCRACSAAFWRSAKPGSLKLIKEALSLSLGVGRARRGLAPW